MNGNDICLLVNQVMMSSVLESTTCVGDVPLACTMKKLPTMLAESIANVIGCTRQVYSSPPKYVVNMTMMCRPNVCAQIMLCVMKRTVKYTKRKHNRTIKS